VGSTVGALRGRPSLPSNQRRGGHGVPPLQVSTHFRNMSQSTKGWPRSATPTGSTHFRKMSQINEGGDHGVPPIQVPLTFETCRNQRRGGHGVPPLQVPLTFGRCRKSTKGVTTECHPYRFHSLSKDVAINEGVATECHPYKFHSLLAVVRDDATRFTDSYFRRDG
jgi:hypothetical protein